MTKQGIEYKTEGNRTRGIVQGYHSTKYLGFIDHSKGAKNSDIAQLPKRDRANITNVAGDWESKFTIGMEVEKARLHRASVKEHALFAGFEKDSSCGYEAITHILPLLGASTWRTKVFSMMHDAEKIIDEQWSQSNYKCGGHITMACEGMDGEEIRKAVRKNMGIFYALFRKRLSNGYCKHNILMETRTGGISRYQAVLVKSSTIEFRLISKFQTVKQMMRRYELCYELMNFSINNPNGSHGAFLKKITPIIVSMYEGDMSKVAYILDLAKHMRKYLTTGKVNRQVINFIDPARNMNATDCYDRELLRNGYRA